MYTTEQLEGIQKLAENWTISYIQDELNKTLTKLSKSTGKNQFVNLVYKPSRNQFYLITNLIY